MLDLYIYDPKTYGGWNKMVHNSININGEYIIVHHNLHRRNTDSRFTLLKTNKLIKTKI